jgi:DNA repair protein RecO (recombination protein O)
MKITLNGIYLGHTNYSDTSVIARVFTAQYGRKSFLFKGVKSKKGQSGLLMPCNHLEFVSNFNAGKELNLAYNIQLKEPRCTIGNDFRKMSVAIFLTEVLNKSLHIETDEIELYNYITQQINWFDTSEFSPNFHLFFLIGLSQYLGFFPKYTETPTERYFNLREGVFDSTPSDIYHLDVITSFTLIQLLKAFNEPTEQLTLSHSQRIDLLKALVKFYEVQLENCTIHSLEVLIQVFE